MYKGIKYQFSYTTGFLKVAHRFLVLMSVEDAFWILVGLIRHYPRLWCNEKSSLVDEGKSNFRFELLCLKSIIHVNYPSVASKLHELGLPIEALVYDSITSLYSDYFFSEALLRIWDMLIFYFNSTQQENKGRAVWLILAPSLLIIGQQRERILKARSAEEVMVIYRDGCGSEYNPNEIINQLNYIIDSVFTSQPQDAHKYSKDYSYLIEKIITPAAQTPEIAGFIKNMFQRIP